MSSFARHETFYIREGWLFKGMRGIDAAVVAGNPPTIFLDDDAPERLGIGRNMVRALRYWMRATGLTEKQLENGRAVQRLTPFGIWVWKRDRYLEHDLTLWLLHYHLMCNQELATTWYWFFNHYSPTSFDESSALNALEQWVTTVETERTVALSSLKKDISCLLQTYLPDDKKKSPEDRRQSPLAQLGILARTGQAKRYFWQRADLTRLEPLAILYVLLDRQAKSVRESNEVRLRDVLYEPMNVGRVFNLTTSGLTEMINLLRRDYAYEIDFVRTASLDQITLPTDVELFTVLDQYYVREQATA